MDERHSRYLRGGLGFLLYTVPSLLSYNSVFLFHPKVMGDSMVSYDHLLKDPRFLENVAEGTGDPGSEQLRFAVERLTEDFVNKEIAGILGLPIFGPGKPSLDDVGREDCLSSNTGGNYGKIYKIFPSNEPHPITLVKDKNIYEEWQGSNLSVKLLRIQLVPEYKTCARYIRESIIWSKMKHRNIAPLLGLWPDFDFKFSRLPGLVSPWFEEGDFLEYISSHPTGRYTPIRQRLFLLSEVMSALRYMHTQEITVVHGDVKTNNILIRDGHAYICDFGLSRIIGTVAGLSSDSSTNDYWLAPERYEGPNFKPTPKSDMYEFGVTFWHVVTGKHPALLTKKMTTKPDNMSDDVWALLQRLLDPDPSSRIDSVAADDFLRGLVEKGVDWPFPLY